jgi:hypothetical protein
VHELGALDDEEARRMLLHLAEQSGQPRVKEVLEQEPGRVKALLLLSGGTPRTLMLLHGILNEGSTSRAEEDLEALLDLVTPYYKARFDDLSAQSQQLVDVVALNWHPISAADCDRRVSLGTNATSALLHRLTKQGVLTKHPGADSSKLTFQIRERFFNIWYLMRASRRLRRKLTWLVGFLQSFYGEVELAKRASELLTTEQGAAKDPARLLAFAEAVSDESRDLLVVLATLPPAEMDHEEGWLRTRSALRRVISLLGDQPDAPVFHPFVWSRLASGGRADEAADLLFELGKHELVMPLYEALRAAGKGLRGSLSHLAPEVRAPAEECLRWLLAETSDGAPAEASPPTRPRLAANKKAPRAASRKPR